jgi:hypothetical protein
MPAERRGDAARRHVVGVRKRIVQKIMENFSATLKSDDTLP